MPVWLPDRLWGSLAALFLSSVQSVLFLLRKTVCPFSFTEKDRLG